MGDLAVGPVVVAAAVVAVVQSADHAWQPERLGVAVAVPR